MKQFLKTLYKRLFEKESLEEMSNLFPKNSGLPFVVWISHKTGNEKHWVRIKVSIDNNFYSVTISDNPEWVHIPKGVSQKKLNQVIEWVKLNKQVLLDHWNQKIDSFELGSNIKKI